MRDGRLDAAKREPVIDHRLGIGKRDLLDLRTEICRDTQALAEHLACGLVGAFAGPAPIDADRHAPQIAGQPCEIVRHGQRHGRRILGILARDHAEHCAAIDRAARHRPDMIQRRREFECAVAADPSPGRLQPGDAVGRGGKADRSAGIGAERSEAEAGRGGEPEPLDDAPGHKSAFHGFFGGSIFG